MSDTTADEMDVKVFLKSVKVGDVMVSGQNLLTHKATDSCEDVFRTLVEKSLSSGMFLLWVIQLKIL